jgi:hypothetical protein
MNTKNLEVNEGLSGFQTKKFKFKITELEEVF